MKKLFLDVLKSTYQSASVNIVHIYLAVCLHMQTNTHIHIHIEPYKFEELVACSKQTMKKKIFFYAYTDEGLKFYLNCKNFLSIET